MIDVRHEVSAVFAADASSRLTGIPGVAVVTAGPGLTNTITAMKNAQLAESALIVIGGATSILLKGRGSLQDINQQSLTYPHCKMIKSINSVHSIWNTFENSFEMASSDVPGPVFIEIPLDILYPRKIIESQLNLTKKNLSFFNYNHWREKMEEIYISRYLKQIYGSESEFNALMEENKPNSARSSSTAGPSPSLQPASSGKLFKYKIFRIPAVSSVIKPAFSALASSSKPLFIIGSQAARSGESDILIDSLVSLSVPVYLSGMARGTLGNPSFSSFSLSHSLLSLFPLLYFHSPLFPSHSLLLIHPSPLSFPPSLFPLSSISLPFPSMRHSPLSFSLAFLLSSPQIVPLHSHPLSMSNKFILPSHWENSLVPIERDSISAPSHILVPTLFNTLLSVPSLLFHSPFPFPSSLFPCFSFFQFLFLFLLLS